MILSNPTERARRRWPRELAEVRRDMDRDPDTSVALLRGDGGVSSAGGDLGMVEAMTRDWA